jgi:integrase/recombinase XerD
MALRREGVIVSKPSRVGVSGPLEPYAVGFRRALAGQGYSRSRATGHLLLMAHLSRWLVEHGLHARDLSDVDVEQFVSYRRAVSRDHRRLTARGVAALLDYLRGLGVVPQPVPLVAEGSLEQLLDVFTGYLVAERGLAAATVSNYRGVAVRFLSGGGRRAADALGSLSAEEVSRFVLVEAARRSAGSLNNVTTGLRALLGFLHVRGYTSVSLVGAVPAAPGWRDDGLPRAVPPDQIRRLLASCDRRTNVGRRDLAILTVLARLGLRAGEVVALQVDDVDWRVGEIEVTGKGNRRERLPLPVDVGQAIAEYCRRGRRGGGCRSLFLHTHAPYVGLSRGGVKQVVARACARAGLARIGAHRLRHSAACAMRAAGAPLLEIGQVLRHRDVAVTAHYARDGRDALVVVARQWPGGAA